MTQTVQIKTTDNKDISFVLRDDGRIFFEDISLPKGNVIEGKQVNLFPYIAFGVLQFEVIILVVLKVFGIL